MVSAVRAISMEKITGDRLMREELLKIVYWNPETAPQGVPKPPARDRVEAAKSVVMLDLAVLNADQTAENCFRDFVDETASNPPTIVSIDRPINTSSAEPRKAGRSRRLEAEFTPPYQKPDCWRS
jgi:hypothetical protein